LADKFAQLVQAILIAKELDGRLSFLTLRGYFDRIGELLELAFVLVINDELRFVS
jgi:hypothetical protein